MPFDKVIKYNYQNMRSWVVNDKYNYFYGQSNTYKQTFTHTVRSQNSVAYLFSDKDTITTIYPTIRGSNVCKENI